MYKQVVVYSHKENYTEMKKTKYKQTKASGMT